MILSELQTNELLAKLLAAENIYVRFNSDISGLAAFDLKSRVLHISKLNDDMQQYTPALLVHEVGHALYTNLPEDTKPEEIFGGCNFLQNVWNAIEDGYVDRKTGKKYPGIKQNRTELFVEVFEKEPKEEQNECKVIELLNLLTANCKGFPIGKFFDWPTYLKPEHVELFNRAIFINEPELVARISFSGLVKDAIAEYGESDAEQDPNGDIMFSDGEADGAGEGGAGGSSLQKLSNAQLDELLEKHKKHVFNDDNIADKLKDKNTQPDEKMTGQFWIEDDIGNLKIGTHKEITELAEIYDVLDFRNEAPENYASYGYPKLLDTHPIFQELKKNFNTVNRSAKAAGQKFFSAFIKQVHARNYSMTSFRKTGTLDPTRASLFQIQDDIFRNKCIQQNQQNHAYVVMLDWSGSMRKSLAALVHRALELVHFANLADVELEIWLYTDTGARQASFTNKLRKMPPEQQQRYSGLLFRQPKFIKVLNTKKQKHELNDRLLNLYISSHLAISNVFGSLHASYGGGRYSWKTLLSTDYISLLNTISLNRNKIRNNFQNTRKHFEKLIQDFPEDELKKMFVNIVKLTSMSGTTIFEALSLAENILQHNTAQIKNIILLSDGSDSNFAGVIGNYTFLNPRSVEKTPLFSITPSLPRSLISDLIAGKINISYDNRQLSQAEIVVITDKMSPAGFIKKIALRLIKKKLIRNEINFNVIGWNMLEGQELDIKEVFGKEALNISSDSAKCVLHRYVQMDNPFIVRISKALLGQSQ
jgi:hypothetical protein